MSSILFEIAHIGDCYRFVMAYELQSLAGQRTLADQAYETLRDAIISGALEAGQVLTDRGLAESLSVSPTPVREALRRLEQDRLVERDGPRTVKVSTYSPTERTEIGLAEDALLSVAAKLAVSKISDSEIDVLEDLLDRADDARASMAEAVAEHGPTIEEVQDHVDVLLGLLREFHERISNASGNTVVLHLLENVRVFSINERRARLKRQIALADDRPTRRYEDHRRILAAIRARDAELAAELVADHNKSARGDVLTS